MNNLSEGQLIKVPIIARFLAWIRKQRGKAPEDRAFRFKNWAKKRGGVDEEGNIKPEWAKKMYIYYRDKEDITVDESFIRDQLESFLEGEDPDLMFE